MMLEISNVSRSFGGLKAVQNVSLQVPRGSLTALIGPNGAGKTTLFALMSGFLIPDAGRIVFDGKDITGRAPQHNAKLGLTRTFQIVQPFAAQTVRENIAVGTHLHHPRRNCALEEAERSPLLRAVLISNGELSSQSATGILPLLTTSAQLLDLSTRSLANWVTYNFPDLVTEEVSDVADALVRLTVSHLALPTWTRPETSRKITEVGLRYLGLSVRPSFPIASSSRSEEAHV